jgi:hypothetical protein
VASLTKTVRSIYLTQQEIVLKRVFFACLICAQPAVSTVYAQMSPEKTGFSIGADLSYNHAKSALLPEAMRSTAKLDKNSFGGRVFAGFSPDPSLFIEIGYFTTGDFKSTVPAAAGVTPATPVEHKRKAEGFDGRLGYKAALEGPHNALVFAGVTRAKIKGGMEKNKSGTGFLLGVGYQADINENLSFRADIAHHWKLGGEKANKMYVASAGIVYNF